VAEYGVRAARQDGCRGAGDALGAGVSDREDATVDGKQLTFLESHLDLRPAEPKPD
jgi:hypothetical protein